MSSIGGDAMSQPKVKVMQGQPPGNQPLNITMEQVTQSLGNAKRRISQRKGELSDNLSDQITQELSQINQMCMQIFGEVQRLTAENENLKKEKESSKALKK